MKKPSNKSIKHKQKISTVINPIECKTKGCKEWALSYSKYCWDHMTNNEKSVYKIKIELLCKLKKIVKDVIFIKADLGGINLYEANFYYANFKEANLSNIEMHFANLSNIDFTGANLSFADLRHTNISICIFENANLIGVDFAGANLFNLNLNGANLSGANFYRADLENILIESTNLNNIKELRIKNFHNRLNKVEKKDSFLFYESYLNLKNYFIKLGYYDDASKAAYCEKVLYRLSYFTLCSNEIYKKSLEYKFKELTLNKVLKIIKYLFIASSLAINYFFKRIFSLIWSALCGYGEKALRPVVSALVIILGYGWFYWYANVLEPAQDLLGSMYFSIVTFTTLGYGDIKPIEYDNVFRFICSSEAFIGAFMIALFVWTLARRGAAR